MQPLAEARNLEALPVLHEGGTWLVVVKPAGMPVFEGRRSLANAVRGMQSRRETAPSDALAAAHTAANSCEAASKGVIKDASTEAILPGSGACDDTATPLTAEPWTVAYDGDARVGGAWLIAKSAECALALLDAEWCAQLQWRCIVRGVPTAAALCGLEEPHSDLREGQDGDSPHGSSEINGFKLLRSTPSKRFQQISEVLLRLSSHSAHLRSSQWVQAAATRGHPLIGGGGRKRQSAAEGPRTECAWVDAVQLVECTAEKGLASPIPTGPSKTAQPPGRFDRLFEIEARIWSGDTGAADEPHEDEDEVAPASEAHGADDASGPVPVVPVTGGSDTEEEELGGS